MRLAIFLLFALAGSAASADPIYAWKSNADDQDRIYLYRDGKQIGGWCYSGKYYRPLDGETWGEPGEKAPVQPPAQFVPSPSVSVQGPLFANGPRARLGNSIAEAAKPQAFAWAGKVIGQAAGEAAGSIFEQMKKELYLCELAYSVKLFAHIELGGKLSDKPDRDDSRTANGLISPNDLMTKGSASVFISERAKFAENLKEAKFTNPVLAMMTFEIESDTAPDPKLIGSLPGGKLQSRLQFSAGDWREEPKTVSAETPVVLMFTNHKLKDANEKNPVTVHCAFVFMALKDGTAGMKTMCLDLYLEKLEPTKGQIVYYPWKVKNTQYK